MNFLHTPVYHITHVDNLPNIIKEKGLWCDHEQRSRMAQQQKIGYEHIKERRLRHLVNVCKRGTLGHYVPFYFAPRSVMLYVIHKGHEYYKGGQNSIVYLVSSIERILNFGGACFFTDRHADLGYAQQCDDLTKLPFIVDFRIMKKIYWADSQDEKEKRQAEFLVHNFCPWETIEEIGVHNLEMEVVVKKILEQAEHKPRMSVRSQWYYGKEKSYAPAG